MIKILNKLMFILTSVLLSSISFGKPAATNIAPSITTFGDIPSYCGTIANHFGPYDYRRTDVLQYQMWLVESEHFTPKVEQLIEGNTAASPHSDINYTLEVFPNHPRALYSMMLFQLRLAQPIVLGNKDPLPIECYFKRALAFTPNDAAVHMVYGIYRYKIKEYSLAVESMLTSLQINPKSAEAHYNIGLIYLKIKNLTEARRHADQAKINGYPLTWLNSEVSRLQH